HDITHTIHCPTFSLSLNAPHTRYTLFPYTTLFRSNQINISVNFRKHSTQNAVFKKVPCGYITTIINLNIRIDCHGTYCKSAMTVDRKSTRLNSSHVSISYAVFCLKKKNRPTART